MATDVISTTVKLSVKNGNFSFDRAIGPLKWDQTNPGGSVPGTINLASGVDTALDLSALTQPTWAIVRNIEPEGTGGRIQVGPESGGAIVPFLSLAPGAANLIFLDPAVTVRANAVGGAYALQFEALEE